MTAVPLNGTLRLNGIALNTNDNLTQANIDAGLVTYDHDDSQTSSDSFNFTVDDGTGTTSSGTFNFTITNVNDAPVQAAIEGAALAYTENDGAVAVTSTLTLSDLDDTHIELAVVQITGNYANGQDLLAFVDQNGITGVWNATNGTLTLTGFATLADYQTALRTVTYQNTSESPNTATRTVSFTVNDGDANSNTLTRDITLTSVNDAPDIVSDGGNAVANVGAAENQTLVTTVQAIDVDLPPDTMTFSLTGGDDQSRFTIDSVTGVLRFVQPPNFEQPTDANADGVYVVEFSVSDGNSGVATQQIVVTVVDINDAPVAVADSFEATAGRTLWVPASGLLANDRDEDGDSISANLVDPPSGGTLVLYADGSFSFAAGANQSGIVQFIDMISDGQQNSSVVTVTINVTGAAPPPGDGSGSDPGDGDNNQVTVVPDPVLPEPPTIIPPTDVIQSVPIDSIVQQPTEIDGPATSIEGEKNSKGTSNRVRFFGQLQSGAILMRADGQGRLQTLRLPDLGGTDVGEAWLPDSQAAVVIDESVLRSSLDKLRGEAEQEIAVAELMTGTDTMLVSAGTIGYVIWTLRAGNLLAFVSATVPAWMTYDPFVVLEEFAGRFLEDAGESLADIATDQLRRGS